VSGIILTKKNFENCRNCYRLNQRPKHGKHMAGARSFVEKMMFRNMDRWQRRREMRFFALALCLGVILAAGVGVILYTLSSQGRI
jgi:hypothetical protein